MGYDYQKLTSAMQEVMRMKVAGLKHTEISELTGLCTQTISNMCTSETGQAFLDSLHARRNDSAADMGARIQRQADRALTLIEEVLEEARPADTKTLLDTAFKVMGIAGYTPTKRVQVESSVAVERGMLDRLNAVSIDAEIVEDTDDTQEADLAEAI